MPDLLAYLTLWVNEWLSEGDKKWFVMLIQPDGQQ